jgi:polyhydroxyalkanoate synthesis repressor PhaR
MTDTARIIKRYANRKLYDTRDSRYVTLDQIAEMIRQREDVKVVDNSTKEDLTSVTLAQIIFEEEKRQRSFLPLAALRRIIESGGESLHDLVSQISESAGRVFRREDEPGAAADAPASEPAEPSEGGGHVDPVRMWREFVEGVQHTVESWHKAIDSNIHHALESMSPLAPLQKQVALVRERLSELEQKLNLARKKPAEETQDTGEAQSGS